jgi:hypothetical protein
VKAAAGLPVRDLPDMAASAHKTLAMLLHEPAEGGPVVEPAGSVGGSLLDGSAACAEAGLDGAREGAAFMESGEDAELFPFEAAEIDAVVDAMNCQVRGNRLETRNGGNFFAFLALGHGVAGNVGAGVVLDGEEKIVDGIAEIEEPNVGLELQTKLGGIRALQ